MCGINGIISKDKNKDKLIKSMNEKILHRGPDAEGIFVEGDVALGQRRLSIIDLAGGNQPIYNEDKSILIMYNGEVYNYKELKEELTEYKFETESDTEVVLHGYEKWGHDLPKKLRGMFAYAIYDKNKGEIFISRDQFGIKPLYYYHDGDTILFGSEIKSFLAYPKFKKVLNKELLGAYLTFSFTPTDETFFKGVYRLPSGHSMTIDVKKRKIKIDRYFKVEFGNTDKSFDEVVKDISTAMKDSTEHHLISDVEVGSFLSSGVDSSYLVSLAKPDKTYTIGFDLAKYSEIDYAKDLTDKLNIKNISEKISKEEYMNTLSEVYYHMDEPTADGCAIAVYFLSRLASKDVKVVLSGEGADEIFGGYNIYHEPYSVSSYYKIPYVIRRFLGVLVYPFRKYRGFNFIYRRSHKLEDRYVGNAFIFDESEKKKILKNKSKDLCFKDVTKSYYEKCKEYDDVTKMQYIDFNTWLIGDILLKADKMSMANSLEVRVPYLDRVLIDSMRKMPTKYKIKDGQTKYAFRNVAKKELADKVANKKKLGFPVPIRVWLRENDTYELIKKTFESDNQFFNKKEIIKLLDAHYKGKRDNSRKIWTVYTFLVWYHEYFS